MSLKAKFSHTNLIARDWRKLASFYQSVFACQIVPPERDLQGDWLEAGTGIKNAKVCGAHLRLPGYGEAGPTLEILQYEQTQQRPAIAANFPGFTHICFAVENVDAARELVFQHGGRAIGETVTVTIPGKGRLRWVYVTDPEGNIIELQKWKQ